MNKKHKLILIGCVLYFFAILPSLITTIWNLGYEFGFHIVNFLWYYNVDYCNDRCCIITVFLLKANIVYKAYKLYLL